MAPILKRPPPNNPETRTEPTFSRLSNRNGASRLVHRLRAGFALLVVVSALNAPGTASAQPDTDRSLNADKPVTAARCRDQRGHRHRYQRSASGPESRGRGYQFQPGSFQPDPRTTRSQGQDPDGKSRLGQHRVGILPRAVDGVEVARRGPGRRSPDRR